MRNTKLSNYRIVSSDKVYIQYKNSWFGWMYLYDNDKAIGGLGISGSCLFISSVWSLGCLLSYYITPLLIFIPSFLFARFWCRYKFVAEWQAKEFINKRVNDKITAMRILLREEEEKKKRKRQNNLKRKKQDLERNRKRLFIWINRRNVKIS